MVVVLKKGSNIKSIQKSLQKLSKRHKGSGFNADAFYGKLKRGLDGLKFQKDLRNEWD
jgi:hypothetical protein